MPVLRAQGTSFEWTGNLAGGRKLHSYGVNFKVGTVAVTLGGKVCGGAMVVSNNHIECTLPLGTLGAKDVVVTTGSVSDTFSGYRYFTGKP